jgi:hypothetical protein
MRLSTKNNTPMSINRVSVADTVAFTPRAGLRVAADREALFAGTVRVTAFADLCLGAVFFVAAIAALLIG